jgi:hypothetical protein
LLSESGNPKTRNDNDDESGDVDTVRAKAKARQKLIDKQNTQLFTLQSIWNDYRFRPKCIDEILSKTQDTRQHHLKVAALCSVLQGYEFALGPKIDGDCYREWKVIEKAEAESLWDSIGADEKEDEDEEKSA